MGRWSALTLLGFILSALVQPACASPWKSGSLYTGQASQEVSVESVASSVAPGSVVIVSENHGFAPHHENQVRFLEALSRVGHDRISVGMEFIARSAQGFVDRFLAGLIPETEFLKGVDWGSISFDLYRRQVLFPRDHAGTTVALNASRAFTGKIAKVGLAGLTEDEKKELPPGFTLGNAAYYERFAATMKDHAPADAIQRYFEAQSVWDETMALTATEYLKSHPEQILVIIVGDFHAIYGGGLPDRLRARGASNVVAISQVNLADLSGAEERETVLPSPKWGPRAEYVWIER